MYVLVVIDYSSHSYFNTDFFVSLMVITVYLYEFQFLSFFMTILRFIIYKR